MSDLFTGPLSNYPEINSVKYKTQKKISSDAEFWLVNVNLWRTHLVNKNKNEWLWSQIGQH